jgi:hypothetical protein
MFPSAPAQIHIAARSGMCLCLYNRRIPITAITASAALTRRGIGMLQPLPGLKIGVSRHNSSPTRRSKSTYLVSKSTITQTSMPPRRTYEVSMVCLEAVDHVLVLTALLRCVVLRCMDIVEVYREDKNI